MNSSHICTSKCLKLIDLFFFRLSDHAKSLFNEVGSAMVQNVKFRDNWVFVGQKGISGFGEIEQVLTTHGLVYS